MRTRRPTSPKAASLALALIPISILSVAACSTVAETAPPPHAGGAMCTADQLIEFTGQPATQELGAKILASSGASVLRWAPKDSMMTMEYRADRVTVHLDGANKVEKAMCG